MPSDQLGNRVGKALGIIGITSSRVSQWLGRPCRCKQRQEKLNVLGKWAARVVKCKTKNAEEYLNQIMEQ